MRKILVFLMMLDLPQAEPERILDPGGRPAPPEITASPLPLLALETTQRRVGTIEASKDDLLLVQESRHQMRTL
ncbi:MAG: hypothetical protein ACR2L3_03305 [Actinomycetota bacterium]